MYKNKNFVCILLVITIFLHPFLMALAGCVCCTDEEKAVTIAKIKVDKEWEFVGDLAAEFSHLLDEGIHLAKEIAIFEAAILALETALHNLFPGSPAWIKTKITFLAKVVHLVSIGYNLIVLNGKMRIVAKELNKARDTLDQYKLDLLDAKVDLLKCINDNGC